MLGNGDFAHEDMYKEYGEQVAFEELRKEIRNLGLLFEEAKKNKSPEEYAELISICREELEALKQNVEQSVPKL